MLTAQQQLCEAALMLLINVPSETKVQQILPQTLSLKKLYERFAYRWLRLVIRRDDKDQKEITSPHLLLRDRAMECSNMKQVNRE
jgi:hypothetical protein